MASREQVESRLRKLLERLAGAGPAVRAQLARTLSSPRVIQMDVPDLEASWWAELAEGRMSPLREGAPAAADIRITARSDDLVAVIDGERNLFSSYVAGQLKIQASLSDLMALRKLA